MAGIRREVGMEEMQSEKTALKQAFHPDAGNLRPMPKQEWVDFFPKRYLVAVLAFLGFCNIYALRVNLSVAIVAMVNNHSIIINGTTVQMAEFEWDSQVQGLVLGSFFYGYIVTQLPGGWLASKFGGKVLFGSGVFGAAILTLLTPLCATTSVYLLVAVRVLIGVCEGVTYPAIHAIWSKWAPPLERSKLATIAFSGSYVGTIIAMPLSAVLANKVGWESVFYVFGSLAIVWFSGWLWWVADTPAQSRGITQGELELIQHGIGFSEAQIKDVPPPWSNFFRSPAVWAIIVAHFAENWGFYTLLTNLPTFLNDTMGYKLEAAGFLSALPYLAMAIVLFLGGMLADCLRAKRYLTTTLVRKIFNCGAFLFQAVFMLVAAYMMTPLAAVVALTIAVGIGGLAWVGFGVNHLDIAPQYAGILMGITNTFGTLGGIISPSVVGAIVKNKTAGEWRIIFFIASAIYILGAIVYGVLASGEVQPWAEIPTGYQPHLDTVEEEERETDVENVGEDNATYQGD